jgi:glycerol-3-phosphate dehydrogenase
MRDLSALRNQLYDLLVIGGGINGAAIAHIAARRGLKVVLAEKGDFGSGTSSKSTKLIHGGIRYLENLEFDLVYESLHERQVQLRAAPHLVKPLGIIIPVYRGDKRPLWMMRLGVTLYDALAGRAVIRGHQPLPAQKILEMAPSTLADGLCGGVLYYDAQMDDFRLCLENILSAADAGADVFNHCEVRSLIKERGKAVGAKVGDLLTGQTAEISAKNIVCAAGPWTNQLLRMDDPRAAKKVRTTKGIHLLYPGQVSEYGFLIPAKKDNRVFFILPWMGHSLIGTTDTSYGGSPDDVRCDEEGIEYLLREARRVFPGFGFERKRVLSCFAGLRPLIRRGGSPSKVSRKHLIKRSRSGVWFVVGGKYTTYRKVAADCVDRIKKGEYGHAIFSLHGGAAVSESAADIAKTSAVEEDLAVRMVAQYGSRYPEVLELIRKNPRLSEPVSADPRAVKAQIVYARQSEMARTPEDILRRLSLSDRKDISRECLSAIGEVLGEPGKGGAGTRGKEHS